MKPLALLVLLSGFLAAQSTLQFVQGQFKNVNAQRVIPRADASHVIIGSQVVPGPVNADWQTTTRSAILLYSITASGSGDFNFGPFPATIGGNGNDLANDAVMDSQGNFWIVGSTDSDDFPLVNPIVSQKVPYRTSGFVLELDPTGRNILFSSYLGGHKGPGTEISSSATKIALGSNGNVYLIGTTSEPDFPTTPGVFGPPGSLADGFEGQIYGWVMQISPAGALVYSTYLGGSVSNCLSGNGCVGILAANVPESMTVDGAGNVTVAGTTSAQDFPTTPGVYQAQCTCFAGEVDGFISRIAPDASHLVWSTYFNGSSLSIATDATGAVFVLGRGEPNIADVNPVTQLPNIFAAKLSADGTALVYNTYLGGATDVHPAGIVLDADGNALMAGTDSSPDFPSLPGTVNLGNDFVLELDPAGIGPVLVYRLVTGTVTQAPEIDASGNLLLLSSQGSLLELYGKTPLSEPAILALGNAATYTMGTGVGPGELVSLYGIGLGPAVPVVGAPDAAGFFPTQLGGVQVTVSGQLAPLLYVSQNQINLQIPFESPNNIVGFPAIQIGNSGALTVETNAIANLGLFYAGAGPNAAALNQDGSVNTASNPAAEGSIVSLFGTGAVYETGVDGAISTAATPLSEPDNHFQVFDAAGDELMLLYAGAAPGLINGAFQLNVVIPPGDLDPALTLHSTTIFGTVTSNSVQVYTH